MVNSIDNENFVIIMNIKTYFRSIDNLCNNSNVSYQTAVKTVYKELKKESTLYGIKPIYIKEIDTYYIPNNTPLDDVMGINK